MDRSLEDEDYLKWIGDPENGSEQKNLHVFDARSYTAAIGNKILGGGTENTNYKNCEVFFLDIDNIHSVRDAYMKLGNLCIKYI